VPFVTFVVKQFDSRFFVNHMTIIVLPHVCAAPATPEPPVAALFPVSKHPAEKMNRNVTEAAASCCKTAASAQWHKSCCERVEV